MNRPYYGCPPLYGILLEESWVLDIVARPGQVTFTAEFVLTLDHPDYHPRLPGEMFCYRTGRLEFTEVHRLVWMGSGAQPATDANGERDFGHIDFFDRKSGEYTLEGDWGRMEIGCQEIRLVLS